MDSQLVSIIIPTFNRSHLLSDVLNSVIEQTHTHWECIIVDDGSTDDTLNILENYCNQDKRFRFYKRPNNRPKGANACRNYGFEKSKGNFVNWFDSDDIMKSDFLESKLNLMQDDLDMVFSYGAYFKDNVLDYEVSKPKVEGTILNFIKGTFYLSTPGPLWKRSFLVNKMLFDENRHKIQDIEFHFRMLIENLNFRCYEANFLFFIRRGEERISSKSGLTTRKLYDVFKYHYNALLFSDKIDKKDRQEYVYITSSKTFASLYEALIFERGFFARINTWKLYSSKIDIALKISGKTSLQKVKIYLGIFMTLIAKKGFKLMTV